MGNSPSSGFNKTTSAAAVASLLFTSGFATAYLFYYRVNRATRLDNFQDVFSNLENVIDALREEIEELKALKRLKAANGSEDDTTSRRSFRSKRGKSTLSSSETEYLSALSDDNECMDEFFDVYDDLMIEGEPESAAGIPAQDEALVLFEKVDNLLEGTSSDHGVALNMLLNAEKEYEDNVEFLWRVARAYRTSAQDAVGDTGKQKDLSFKAVDYGTRALKANPDNAEANKWYAISLGSLGPFVSVSEKIKNGGQFKSHIDKAITINPKDPVLHHLLGRFCFEVSLLSWIERKVATTLFSEMPTGTVDEALAHFQEAEQLRKKPWKENRLFIARCYVHLGQYSNAIRWIDQALEVPVLTNEEKTMQTELEAMQKKYSGYRASS